MEQNIQGAICILKTMEMKPNFSELGRKYGMDRHTIAKYWKQGGIKKVKERFKTSRLDKYEEEIKEIISKPGVTIKATYEYMKDKYGSEAIGSYNNFRYYGWKNEIRQYKTKTPHVRYETVAGEQLQVDWKENVKMMTRQGEQIEFNLLTSTLGYSRFHTFIYSKGKTTEDFLRCLIETINRLGGTPKKILTDNMTAVVSITNGGKRKHEKIKAFEKDTGIKIQLCKTRSPETKGKVESSNRYVSWIKAYDGEIEDEEELIKLLNKLNQKVNEEINQTTKIPPQALFQKEKEYLNPLPNKVLLESYVDYVQTQVVPQTLLVTYKGKGYSVPPQFINQRVKILNIEDKLYLYSNTELITVHTISQQPFNYREDHYREALKKSIYNKEIDIEEVAKENLALLEQLGGKQ